MAEPDPTRRSVEAYTNVAQAYAEAHAEKLSDRAQRFAERLSAGAVVLDAGCGPGRDLARFRAAGHRPVGLDLNARFAAMASASAPTVVGDLRAVGSFFRPGSIDGVWAAASLVHLSHADARLVLAAFGRILRPGGSLFLALRSVGETGWLDEPDGRRWYSVWQAADAVRAVEQAGFLVDEVNPDVYTEVWATSGGRS